MIEEKRVPCDAMKRRCGINETIAMKRVAREEGEREGECDREGGI